MTPEDFQGPHPGQVLTHVFVVTHARHHQPMYFAITEGIAVQAAQAFASDSFHHPTEVHRIPLNKWLSLTPSTLVYRSGGPAAVPAAFPKPEAQLGFLWSVRTTRGGRQRLAVFGDDAAAIAKTRARKDALYGIWQDGYVEVERFGMMLVRGWYQGVWRYTPGWEHIDPKNTPIRR